MMRSVQLNAAHLVLLLPKRNHPVLTGSALTAVKHFLLTSSMNIGNAKSVKSSTCVNLHSLEDCRTCIRANSVPIRFIFSFSSNSMPQANLQYLWQVKESPQLLRQRQGMSMPITGAEDITGVQEGARPSTRTTWAAKSSRTSRSQLLHFKSRAILLTSSYNKNWTMQL